MPDNVSADDVQDRADDRQEHQFGHSLDQTFGTADANLTLDRVAVRSTSKLGSGKGNSASDTSSQLFLSVFLNLMAFFAVLVGLSDFEESKTDMAIQSIHESFGANVVPNGLQDQDPSAPTAVHVGDERQRLSEHLKKLAKLRRISLTQDDDIIEFQFQPHDLFIEPKAQLKMDQNVLFVRLVALLNQATSNRDLEIWVQSPEIVPATGVSPIAEMIKDRLTALLLHLTNIGAPINDLSLSLRSGEDFLFGFRLAESVGGLKALQN